jgi:hypothetical protein
LIDEVETYIISGSKITAIKHYRNEVKDKFTGYFPSLRECKDVVDNIDDMMHRKNFRDKITSKILELRTQIEKWCELNGYDNLGLYKTRKNKTGEYVWNYTDWEFVDDSYGNMINDPKWYPHPKSLKDMNKLWKKYSINKRKLHNSKMYDDNLS